MQAGTHEDSLKPLERHVGIIERRKKLRTHQSINYNHWWMVFKAIILAIQTERGATWELYSAKAKCQLSIHLHIIHAQHCKLKKKKSTVSACTVQITANASKILVVHTPCDFCITRQTNHVHGSQTEQVLIRFSGLCLGAISSSIFHRRPNWDAVTHLSKACLKSICLISHGLMQ